MSIKAVGSQNDVSFTIFETKYEGKLPNLIDNLSVIKKKTEEYYAKIISSSIFINFKKTFYSLYIKNLETEEEPHKKLKIEGE